jgi:hypothetical protein
MKTIIKELGFLVILIASAFCTTFAAIFRAIHIGFKWLDDKCVELGAKTLEIPNKYGYNVTVEKTTESNT